MEVLDLAKLYRPCIVLLTVDQIIKTHYVGAYVDEVYCTSNISEYVYGLMVKAIQT